MADGRLTTRPRFVDDAAVCVVAAAPGYPEAPRTGDPIDGLDAVDDPAVRVFHAGTRIDGGRLVTAGGRVLGITALAPTVAEARRRAYAATERISWPGMVHRTDIAERAAGGAAPTHREETVG